VTPSDFVISSSQPDVWHWMGVVEEYPRDPSKVNIINNNYLNYVSEKGESTSPRLRSTDFHCLETKQNRRTT
jgi:hypothetical protein